LNKRIFLSGKKAIRKVKNEKLEDSTMDYFFSDKDRQAVESLHYNPDLKPSFELFKFCLVWDDERPLNISSAGYDLVCDLWIARSFMYHRKLPKNKWGLDPGYFQKIWDTAIKKKLNWPGFKRLELSPEDEKYLNDCIASALKERR
jgi:hypothetical protein